MNSYRTSKFNSKRPGSSAKVYDYENSSHECRKQFEFLEKISKLKIGALENSKIPRLPRRTYSLEGRSDPQEQKSFTRTKISTTSMIPRLEANKHMKYSSSIKGKNKKRVNTNISNIREKVVSEQLSSAKKENPSKEETEEKFQIAQSDLPVRTVPSLESKLNKDFVDFKNNVLKIPEYWTDAGKTAATILKNAVNIVKKQYPNMEKESFEAEIESILKATDAVKQQILLKTEHIINKATEIYAEGNDGQWNENEDEIKKITKKMEELKDEVRVKKYVFGDLLKCSNEVKQLMELEKVLKQKVAAKENQQKEFPEGMEKNEGEEENQRFEGKKNKKAESQVSEPKKKEKSSLNSCGDIVRQNSNFAKNKREDSEYSQKKEKTTQTAISWVNELLKNENTLSELNQKVLELQELCKDHISKFKSFNLQIKLRGICNKAQRTCVSKELEILNDEKTQLEEKNSQLLCYNKDLESAIKKKDLDLHQKEKLIIQQKKLLNVRDELIEMLKNRCNLEERQLY